MLEQQLYEISAALGKKLKAQGFWVTCAESCTGGAVAKAITEIAGSSAYFDRGFITYSNKAKQELLGVSEDVLLQYGAVSEETVSAMAKGALRSASADLAVAISGIAGPDGGSKEKPVGTVYFGLVKRDEKPCCFMQIFSGSRAEIRLKAAIFALNILSERII